MSTPCNCPTCALFTPIGPLRPEIEEKLRNEQIKKIKELAEKLQVKEQNMDKRRVELDIYACVECPHLEVIKEGNSLVEVKRSYHCNKLDLAVYNIKRIRNDCPLEVQ